MEIIKRSPEEVRQEMNRGYGRKPNPSENNYTETLVKSVAAEDEYEKKLIRKLQKYAAEHRGNLIIGEDTETREPAFSMSFGHQSNLAILSHILFVYLEIPGLDPRVQEIISTNDYCRLGFEYGNYGLGEIAPPDSFPKFLMAAKDAVDRSHQAFHSI